MKFRNICRKSIGECFDRCQSREAMIDGFLRRSRVTRMILVLSTLVAAIMMSSEVLAF